MFNSPKWVNASLPINEQLTCLQLMGTVIAFFVIFIQFMEGTIKR